MNKSIFLLIVALHVAVTVSAQQFLPPIQRFSSSKPGYLITRSGQRVEFTLDDLDRKRGLIIRVEGKTLDGKKFKYEADEVQELGLAPSDYAKLSLFSNSTRSVAKMHGGRWRDGYATDGRHG